MSWCPVYLTSDRVVMFLVITMESLRAEVTYLYELPSLYYIAVCLAQRAYLLLLGSLNYIILFRLE